MMAKRSNQKMKARKVAGRTRTRPVAATKKKKVSRTTKSGAKKIEVRKQGARLSAKEEKDELVFKALANVDRRRILDLLKEEPRTVGSICEEIDNLDRCTVMLHLGVLEKANLIIAKKEGRFRWNYLNVEPVQRVYNRWIKDYAQPAADMLLQLKDEIESR